MAEKALSVLIQARDKLTAPVKAAIASTGKFQAKIKQLDEQMKNAQGALKSIEQYKRLASQTGKVREQYRKAEKNLGELNAKVKAGVTVDDKLIARQKLAAAKVKELGDRIKAQAQASNKAQRELKGMGVDTGRLTSEQKRLNRELATGTTRLNSLRKGLLNRQALLSKAGAIGKTALTGLGVGTGIIGAGAAVIFAQLKQATGEADKLAKLSSNLGISQFNVQSLRFSGELSGVTSSDIDSSLTRFSKRIGTLKAGSGALFGFLNRVDKGLAATLKKTTSNDQAFDVIADYIAKLKDVNKQSAIADAAFGDSGRRMLVLLRQGSSGLAKAREEFQRFGGGIDEKFAAESERFNDAIFKIQTIIGAVKFKLLGPVLTQLTKKAEAFINQFKTEDGAQNFIKGIIADVKTVLGVFDDIFTAIKFFIDVIKSVAQIIAFPFVLTKEIITDTITLVSDAINKVKPFLNTVGAIKDKVSGAFSSALELFKKDRANPPPQRTLQAFAQRQPTTSTLPKLAQQGLLTNRVDSQSTVKLQIESPDARVKVKKMESDNHTNVSVDTGLFMGGLAL